MSEHKTGNSNWNDDQKRAYRSKRERGIKDFHFTKRGFAYRNGPTEHAGKETVTRKAMRKLTRRARRFLGQSDE